MSNKYFKFKNINMDSKTHGPQLVLKSIEGIKNEGNREFSTKNYIKAIKLYEEGLRRA